MFIVILTYKVPLEEVEKFVNAHRSYLDAGYQTNAFVASGPKNPRTGGIIISQLKDKEALENILKEDPFIKNDIAAYEILEFNPVKYHPNFASFIN